MAAGGNRRVHQLTHQFESGGGTTGSKPIDYSHSITHLRKRKLVMAQANHFNHPSPPIPLAAPPTQSLRMSPGVQARSNSLSSGSRSPRRLPSDASTHPSPAGNPARLFSPHSNATTAPTSLPQDAASSLSNPDHQPGWVPTTSPLRKLSQRSNQSSIFGIGISDNRPATSSGTYPHDPPADLAPSDHDRQAHSSLPSSKYPHLDSDLPSFSYCVGDRGIEDLLETLGYSSNSNASCPAESSKPRDKSRGRDPVVMLDIEGDEFTIHEHSLSPVS